MSKFRIVLDALMFISSVFYAMRLIKNVGLIVLGVLVGIAGSMANSRIEAQSKAPEITFELRWTTFAACQP